MRYSPLSDNLLKVVADFSLSLLVVAVLLSFSLQVMIVEPGLFSFSQIPLHTSKFGEYNEDLGSTPPCIVSHAGTRWYFNFIQLGIVL